MLSTIDELRTSTEMKTRGQRPEEMGQEDFLKLMVAQLKNQDPSNPADNSEFLGQIAQFSMVSGIEGLNSSFDSMAGSLYSSQAMQASQLVGKKVLAETDSALLAGGGVVEGRFEVPTSSFNTRIMVEDMGGNLVDSIELGPTQAGDYPFSWAGITSDGEALPPGKYRFKAESTVDGESETLPLSIFSHVNSISVDRNNTSIRVHLDGNQTIGLSQVSEYK